MSTLQKKILLMYILGLTCFNVCFAEPPELPAPPANFSWQWCEKIKSAFLKPKGWHFKQMTKQGTYCCFISKEDIDKEGKFDTGLTVNVVTEIPKKSKVSPSGFAQTYIKQAATTKKVLKKWTTEMGPFKGYGCVFESKGSIVHNLLIANDKTGSIYIILFESPVKEWSEAWKTGEKIMQKLYIDDEI